LKAIIFSHEKGGSYVMDSEGFFDFVKGYTKQPIGTEIEIADTASHPPITIMRIMSYAACFIVVISLSIFAYLWNTVNYSVYVDINPSVEMRFNAVNRLKTTLPVNEDGTQLLDGLKLRGSAENTVPALILAVDEKGYLNITDGETAVLITVVVRRGGSPDALISSIMTALDKHNMLGFVSIESCTNEFSDRAESLGVSPGKLKMAEALILASDMPLSLEEALQLSVDALFMAASEAGAAAGPDGTPAPTPGDGNNSANTGDNNPASPGADQGSNPTVDIQADPSIDPGTDFENPIQNNTNTDPGGIVPGSPGPGNSGVVPGSPGNAGQAAPTTNPGSQPENASQASPTTTPDDSRPGNTSQPDPDPGSDDSLWITDLVKPDTGADPKPDTDPGKDEPKNPNTGPGNNNGNNDKNEPKEPEKPTEGYVEPICDKDGYWWSYNAADDVTSYTYNPGTALGHSYGSIFWEDGLGWYGTCSRCGKTVFISSDPNYGI